MTSSITTIKMKTVLYELRITFNWNHHHSMQRQSHAQLFAMQIFAHNLTNHINLLDLSLFSTAAQRSARYRRCCGGISIHFRMNKTWIKLFTTKWIEIISIERNTFLYQRFFCVCGLWTEINSHALGARKFWSQNKQNRWNGNSCHFQFNYLMWTQSMTNYQFQFNFKMFVFGLFSEIIL